MSQRGRNENESKSETKKYRKQVDAVEELTLEQKLRDLERQLELIKLKLDFVDNGLMSTNKRLDNIMRTLYSIYKLLKSQRRKEGEEE